MKSIPFIALLLLCLIGKGTLSAKEKAAIIVAQDGSGAYRTIQEAIEAVPAENKQNVVILIKNGIYREKIFLTKSHITLVGEDKDSTRIIYPVLRTDINQNWMDMRGDWGAGVVNIDSTATDITLANLTVHNNYGSLHNTDAHQFAIRGKGTRTIIINCRIIADGGDTVSLWNKISGMYYHAFCYFEGGVDFVCPRGWCYITDSKFFGRSKTASIWHDGDNDISQKFVIRNSSFDGIPGFALGRNGRDGQMFLLDCRFSQAMADTPIYWPKGSKTTWQWGDRHYFYNCHRDGGDYAWFSDNLTAAAGAPVEKEITSVWAFDGKWDPESTMPSVLPMVFLPRPRDGAASVPQGGVELKWVPSRNADRQLVYFGKEGRLQFKKNQKARVFRTGRLAAKTTYTWRVDEIAGTDTLRGPVWQFTTR